MRADAQNREVGLSESLSRRLAAHRIVALQVMLSRNTSVALVALAHMFVQRAFGDEHRRAGSALQIAPQLSAHALKSVADDLVRGAAWQAIEAAKLAWAQRMPEKCSAWFDWLIGLPQAELLDLLALCTALTLNALPGTGATSDANALAEAVGLDMADWWEPTAVGYLSHIGLVGPVVMAVALLCALGRLNRALWLNHRYRFTTWRWGRFAAALLLVGAVLKLTMPG